MMYRPPSNDTAPRQGHSRKSSRHAALCLVCVAATFLAFVSAKMAHGGDPQTGDGPELPYDDEPIAYDETLTEAYTDETPNKVYRKRLLRSEIPPINFYNTGYRECFNDSNYVQLSSARANGLDPATVGDPESNSALVPIFSTTLCKVDTMYHSRPFLVPEAALLLDYLGHRFRQLMSENHPEMEDYKIIVTSALRTEQSERRLRRVNRNATDTSCHVYGTTFDLSAQRYEHVASGRDTVIEACKQMLATALYELRYEGLCYVKYERGSCFHITLRTTQYEGASASEIRSYCSPGSPDYLLTKAPPRPAARPQPAARPSVQSTAASPDGTSKNGATKTSTKKKSRSHDVAPPTGRKSSTGDAPKESQQRLTDRERLSLEQFERNY